MIPRYRFAEFSEVIYPTPLSLYLSVNAERNKTLLYSKEDVLSVSGELGIVNQIELLGRSYAGESVAEYHIVENNDIVYTKSPLKANPYGIVKCNKGKAGIVSTLYAVYHCKGSAVPQYVDYYFAYDNRLNRYLKPLVRIGAKHDMKIGNEEVLSGTVAFPSLPEQQKIADFLTAYDEKISLQQQKVEALERRKNGLLQKVFSQKIRFKADDGSEFPEWTKASLFDRCQFSRGQGLSKAAIDDSGTNEAILYGNLYTDYGMIINNVLHFTNESKKNKILSEKGDILIPGSDTTPTGLARASCIMVDNCILGGDINILKPKYDNGCCLSLCINANRKKLIPLIKGSSVKHINNSDIQTVILLMPSDLREQEMIVDFFSAIDEQIEIEKKRLESMQTIKKGLLQQMFCDGSAEEKKGVIYTMPEEKTALSAAQSKAECERGNI